MTDTHYYEIKSLSVEDKKKGKKVLDILFCIKRKLNTFFVITFILFLFFLVFHFFLLCSISKYTKNIFKRFND